MSSVAGIPPGRKPPKARLVPIPAGILRAASTRDPKGTPFPLRQQGFPYNGRRPEHSGSLTDDYRTARYRLIKKNHPDGIQGTVTRFGQHKGAAPRGGNTRPIPTKRDCYFISETSAPGSPHGQRAPNSGGSVFQCGTAQSSFKRRLSDSQRRANRRSP